MLSDKFWTMDDMDDEVVWEPEFALVAYLLMHPGQVQFRTSEYHFRLYKYLQAAGKRDELFAIVDYIAQGGTL